MQEPSSGPPNPRHSRYQQLPVRRSGTPVTIALIIVSCIVAAISQLGERTEPVSTLYFAEPSNQDVLYDMYYRIKAMEENGNTNTAEFNRLVDDYLIRIETESSPLRDIKKGEVWRLATPMFLHFGIIHILFNMMWIWSLGLAIESTYRPLKFAVLVLTIAVISNIAQALISGPNFGGMSGVVYGLFGFIVVHGKLNPHSGLHLDKRTVNFMLIWLVLCFTGLVGPIANWAHTFGLLTGAIMGGALALKQGGWQTVKRRHEFKRAASHLNTNALHECCVCGKTELDDPYMDFRVHEDGNEYCVQHLKEID